MFRSDLLFATILVVLLVLPFLSVYPNFERIPYELFFSALGAASIIILAWERIADRRGQRLQNLMTRVYLDEGEIELSQALWSISRTVTTSDLIPDQDRDAIAMAIAVLRQAGHYHGIDYLYPRNAFTELAALQDAVRDYTAIWKGNQEKVKDFASITGIGEDYVSAVLKGLVTLVKAEDGTFVPYMSDGVTPSRGYGALNQEQGQRLKDFVTASKAVDRERLGVDSQIWRMTIHEGAISIAHEFTVFLEKNGIPAPFAKPKQQRFR
jgi:hypothetical protein